jgi:hypothetical protein
MAATKSKTQKTSRRQRKKSKQWVEPPKGYQLFARSYRFMIDHWRVLGGIMLIYAVVYFLLVRGAPNVDLSEFEQDIDSLLGEDASSGVKTFTLAGAAIAASSQGGGTGASTYGAILFVIGSLAIIWALRHLFAKKGFRIKDAFYNGMTPFVPFVIILLLIAVQLLPFGLSGSLYALVKTQGITASGFEDLIFIGIWVAGGLLSGWLIANSLMSLYAVTLPGIYPLTALRATKRVVREHRWIVLRRILFLPVVLLILFFIFLLFVITIWPNGAFLVIDISSIVVLLFAHIYYYHLYRSLV